MLGNGYDTNCYEYDLDYKYGNFNMKSDCITHCFYGYIMKKCDYGHEIPGSTFLLREEALKYMNGTIGLKKECYEDSAHSAYAECSVLCRPDCNFTYYVYENAARQWETWDIPKIDEFYFNLNHNSNPDIVIKYLPQTTFLSFVCSFGGLLGMWLGFSFLTFLDEGIRIIWCPP